MSKDPNFDRWYAATHVKIVLHPSHELETFGSTLFNYHLISELDDHPGKIRIREGRLEAHQPRVIMPTFNEITAEGLGDAAKDYLEFLRDNMRILQYGYNLKSDKFSEQIVTDSLAMRKRWPSKPFGGIFTPFAAAVGRTGIDSG